jgi:D-alanyl-D-alanine carboxypeptidase (penicillin-binding protein 5/6)
MTKWRNFYLAIITTAVVLSSLVTASTARAAHRPVHHKHHAAAAPAPPLFRGALLEDADTGKILMATNADMEWPPASMAKMMLILVAEDQINAGRFSLNDPVRISERAAQTGGSRVGMREGQVYPLGELIKAAVIKSANDAAVAIAEKVAGSVEACVRMMNQRARQLGMTQTLYQTVDGLPPRPTHDADVTSALDLATVARELIHRTNILQLTGLETAMFDDGEAVLHNTNHLIGHFEGCDGLKTGFTWQAGFNLTATAKRGNMRLVAVILGAPSNPQRFTQAAKLMEWGFDNFESVALLRQGQTLPVHVQVESGPSVQPIAASSVKLVVPKSDLNEISLQYSVPPVINQPVPDGAAVGQVIVLDGGQVLTRVNAIFPSDGAQLPGASDTSGGAAASGLAIAAPAPDGSQESR